MSGGDSASANGSDDALEVGDLGTGKANRGNLKGECVYGTNYASKCSCANEAGGGGNHHEGEPYRSDILDHNGCEPVRSDTKDYETIGYESADGLGGGGGGGGSATEAKHSTGRNRLSAESMAWR